MQEVEACDVIHVTAYLLLYLFIAIRHAARHGGANTLVWSPDVKAVALVNSMGQTLMSLLPCLPSLQIF